MPRVRFRKRSARGITGRSSDKNPVKRRKIYRKNIRRKKTPRLRSLSSLNDYEPTIRLVKASFDPLFVKKVRENIMNPEIIEGMNSEVCGSMNIDNNLRLSHDPSSANRKNEHGFQKGGVETSPEGRNQFCHPKKYSSRILWHTHPRGVPAYPSGSDIFVTMVKDCSGSDTAQAYIEFLFTEHGFWIIHRRVTPENTLMPAIDITRTGGNGIKMRDVETMITKLEDETIRPEYYRDKIPNRKASEKITNHLMKLTYKNLVHVRFHPWETEEFDIPEALFQAKVTDVCLKQ